MDRLKQATAPRLSWWYWLTAGCVLVAGCSSAKTTFSGKVTYDGKPLPVGTITFDPDRAQGNEGVRLSGNIKDGVYRTTPVDGAPREGPLIVRIIGYDGKPLPGKEGVLSPKGTPLCYPHEERIQLAEGMNSFDFDIPAKKE